MDLRHIISNLMQNNPRDESVREFINICRKIAVVHLRRKAARGRLHPELQSTDLNDVAVDCIADLFHRDESNNLIQIRAYFNGIAYQEMGEDELLAHITRLVLSKTNHRLFRVYNELDPALGKILRNIKLAIQALHNFVETERLGETCIVPAMCEMLEHLPSLDRIDIEKGLRLTVRGDESVPALLAQLSFFLREQNENSRILPVMTVAFALRSLFRGHEIPAHTEPVVYDHLLTSDVENITKDVCRKLEQETEQKYVGQKGVDPEIFKEYFVVIQEHLGLKIIGKDGSDHSFFDRLKQAFPGLTREEYHKAHKSRIDYLAGLAYKQTIQRLKKEIK